MNAQITIVESLINDQHASYIKGTMLTRTETTKENV